MWNLERRGTNVGYLLLLSAVLAGTLFGDTVGDAVVSKRDPFQTATHRCVQIELVNGNNGPEYRCSAWKKK